jgi:hypothetical protein
LKITVIIGFIVVAILGFSLYRRLHSRSQAAQQPAPKDVYMGLRNLALQGSREKLNLAPTSSPTEPWEAIMDWGVPHATATIVAFSDGHASIYLSNGGGYLGGAESHESVRSAAKKMVAAAIECQSQTHATSDYPLPQQGEVFFYLLTDAGIFTASALQKDLSTHRHPLSRLGDAAQKVINEYRIINPTK